MENKALETLGQKIKGNEGRDAIHLAVIPVQATMQLEPGYDTGVAGNQQDPIGIVDPFLKTSVFPGEYFWLVLYPRTITSLRHEWTHPAIADRPSSTAADTLKTQTLSNSKRYIIETARQLGLNYQGLLEATANWVQSGEYYFSGDNEMYLEDEFWDHYEQVTGTKVVSHRKESFFTCAC